jgi:basic membrane protein A
MSKKLFVVLSVLLVVAMALTACAKAAPATTAATKVKVCMVTDSGGIGDKSFNDLTWSGVQKGIKDFGIEGNYIQSSQATDFAPNLQACKDSGAKLIICVGFMMADDCKKAATDNPTIDYAGVDMAGFNLPNFRGVTAAEEQPAYLAGYLAAGMTKTGVVGWYVGIMGPAVSIFGDGYYAGVQKYNEAHGTTVKEIGYDPANVGGALATGSWVDASKGTEMGNTLTQEKADIILPVDGGVGAATAAVLQGNGSGYIFGVDQDWTQTYPQYSAQVLASLLKKVDVHVYDAISRVVNNKWEGGDMVLTLANGGADLAYNPAITVPDALKAEIADLKAKIISGDIKIPLATVK